MLSELVAGIGRRVEDVLVRTESIPKSSKGNPRNANLHWETLAVIPGVPPPSEPVVLIDDVTTSGAQMIGAARCLIDAFPCLTGLHGFALIRTTGEAAFGEIHDPARRVARITSEADGTCSFGHDQQ